jgi:hypothetical protein
MAKVEDKMFSKPAPTPSKLPSLGTNQIVSAEEMVKIRSDNQTLREKLTEMQKAVRFNFAQLTISTRQ